MQASIDSFDPDRHDGRAIKQILIRLYNGTAISPSSIPHRSKLTTHGRDVASWPTLNYRNVGLKSKELLPVPIISRHVWYECTLNTGNSRAVVNVVAISLDSAGTEVVSVRVLATRAVIVTGDDIPI